MVLEDRLRGGRSRGESDAETGYGQVQAHGPARSGRLRQLPTPFFRPEQTVSHITSGYSS